MIGVFFDLKWKTVNSEISTLILANSIDKIV